MNTKEWRVRIKSGRLISRLLNRAERRPSWLRDGWEVSSRNCKKVALI